MSDEKRTYKEKLTKWLSDKIQETDKEMEKREKRIMEQMQSEMEGRKLVDNGTGKYYYTQRILEETSAGIRALLTQKFAFSMVYDFAKKTKE